MRNLINTVEGIEEEVQEEAVETELQTDHGIIPSDEPKKPEVKRDNVEVYGRKFQR